MTLGPVGVAVQTARPAGPGTTAPAAGPGLAPRMTGSSAPDDPAVAAESTDAAPPAVPGPDFLALLPMWRSLPAPDPQLQERLMAGQLPPPGGKGVPPRIPVVPIELPGVNVPGSPANASPVAITVAAGADPMPDAGTEPRMPGAESRAGSALPPLAAADEAAAETAMLRMPREIVGRMPDGAGYPPAPVLSELRRQASSQPQVPAPTIPALRAAAPEPAVAAAAVAARLLPALVPGDERQAAGTLPDAAAVPEAAGAGPGVSRLATGPDAGILSAATITQPSQPGAPAMAAAQQHLPEQVGSEEWAEAVAQRLSQLAESPHARANIRLNPPQLGPMQIEVHVDGDRAVVQLAVHHDATRDALEQAMPKLRAQLENSGFASIDVSVSRNPHRERPGAQPYHEAVPPTDDDLPAPVAGSRAAPAARLLDAYA